MVANQSPVDAWYFEINVYILKIFFFLISPPFSKMAPQVGLQKFKPRDAFYWSYHMIHVTHLNDFTWHIIPAKWLFSNEIVDFCAVKNIERRKFLVFSIRVTILALSRL